MGGTAAPFAAALSGYWVFFLFGPGKMKVFPFQPKIKPLQTDLESFVEKKNPFHEA